MTMIEFEWDAKKAKANLAKHGVEFGEAATVLRDPLSITIFDPDHSRDEDRYARRIAAGPWWLLIRTVATLRESSAHAN